MENTEITSHRINLANDTIRIKVTDKPGAGGANHRYEIGGFDISRNPSRTDADGFHAVLLL